MLQSDQERSRQNSKIQRPYNRSTTHVECKNKCDTNNNRGNWNHLKIIQKIPEQRTGKARNEVTTESSYIGHCTHTAESAIVKVRKI
jgi:hypothetical protein